MRMPKAGRPKATADSDWEIVSARARASAFVRRNFSW